MRGARRAAGGDGGGSSGGTGAGAWKNLHEAVSDEVPRPKPSGFDGLKRFHSILKFCHFQHLVQLLQVLRVSRHDVAAVDVLNAGDVDGREARGRLRDALPEQHAEQPVARAIAVDEPAGDDASGRGKELCVGGDGGAHDQHVLDEPADGV